jgi:hypothetical protein
MKKIISLFERNYDGDGLVHDEIVLGAEWVADGEGIATRKWDGTCCMIRDGKIYKRYDAKKGKTPPKDFEPAQDYDQVTGHMPGWVPVGDGPEDQWHREGFKNSGNSANGTYELVGPKLQGNPEKLDFHQLIPHGVHILENVPRTFDGLRNYLKDVEFEGIVWHHPDSQMVKIKRKDFWK